MDYELFYEEIEGFGLVYKSREDLTNFKLVKSCNWKVTNQQNHTR
jgi:hypothetical protein